MGPATKSDATTFSGVSLGSPGLREVPSGTPRGTSGGSSWGTPRVVQQGDPSGDPWGIPRGSPRMDKCRIWGGAAGAVSMHLSPRCSPTDSFGGSPRGVPRSHGVYRGWLPPAAGLPWGHLGKEGTSYSNVKCVECVKCLESLWWGGSPG